MFAPRKRPGRGLVPSIDGLEDRLVLSRIAPLAPAPAEVSIQAAKAEARRPEVSPKIVIHKPKAAPKPKIVIHKPKAIPRYVLSKPKPVHRPAAPQGPSHATPAPKPVAVPTSPTTPGHTPEVALPQPTAPQGPSHATPAPVPAATSPTTTGHAPDVDTLIGRINADRAALGLRLLAVDEGLIARAKAQVDSHHQGQHVYDDTPLGAGEVMAAGSGTAHEAYAAMKSSPSQLAAMMDPAATRVGAAAVWDQVTQSFENPSGRGNSLYMILVA